MAASWDQLEIISPHGEIKFYPLASPTGMVRIGREPNNDLVIASHDDPSYHVLLDYRQPPYQIVLLSQTEEVKLRGQRLHPRVPVEIHHLNALELGGYVIILLRHERRTAGPWFKPSPILAPTALTPDQSPPSFISAGEVEAGCWPDPPQSRQSEPLLTTIYSDQADPFIITELSTQAWLIDVEQTAVGYLTLKNGGRSAGSFTVRVVGLAENWVHISSPQVNLQAGEQTILTLTIRPPRQPASLARLYQLAVVVTSPDYPGRWSQKRAQLSINPYYEFAVGELSPRQQTISWSKRSTQLTIPITNKGNSDTLFRLAGADVDQACSFEFELPDERVHLARQAELNLAPGQTLHAPIRLTPPTGQLVGLSKRTYYFTITTTVLNGPAPQRAVLGQLTRLPLIGPGLIAFLTLGLVLLSIPLFQVLLDRYMASFEFTRTSQESRPRPLDNLTDQRNWPASSLAGAPPGQPAAQIDERMTYQEMFQEIAPQYGLDWRILAEQAYRESRLDPYALGAAMDMGLMQIIPATWSEWAPKVGVSDPYDPYSNVQVAAAYLAYLREYCQRRGYSEPHWMLVAYNWGPENIDRLFKNRGDWTHVPEKQRQYALTILQAAEFRLLTAAEAGHASLSSLDPNLIQGSYANQRLDELLAEPIP